MSMTRDEYRDVYLKSDHWLQVRAAALARAERRCQVCNASEHLDVHHRTYERLGRERVADLTVLCRGCHDAYHEAGSGNEHGAFDDAAKAIVEARRQKLLLILALSGAGDRGTLRRYTGWSAQHLGFALAGLEARGLTTRSGPSSDPSYAVSDDGRRWAFELIHEPEPCYWRLPEDPRRRADTKAAARAIYR